MELDRWSEVEKIYHEALEQNPQDRMAFLNHNFADEQLRREVESLLAYQSHDEGFIETPVLEVAARLLAEGCRGNRSRV